MDGGRKKRVGAKRSSKVDWLSNLPESLLCKVLLNLPTKDVVKCSVLSKRWRNLWRHVPGFDLNSINFPKHKTFVRVVDAFLGLNTESYLESFKLRYFWYDEDDENDDDDDYEPESGLVNRWINTVVDRRVKHLVFVDNSVWCSYIWDIQMPPSLYTCESLVSLKLEGVILASPMFGSLPCLKFMDLTIVHFANALGLETLISGCPVLESLYIRRDLDDNVEVLRVCSQSLLRFTHSSTVFEDLVEDHHVVEVNAPRLQHVRLGDDSISSYVLNNTSSLVEANIDTVFNFNFENKFENDLQRRKMILSLLEGISCVKDMTITSKTLEVIYLYSRCEQLPVLPNLSFLRVNLCRFRWERLPIFLESCPNIKSLVVASEICDMWLKAPELGILSVPRCVLSSLEFVDIESPHITHIKQIELVRYFLENSATLKKLTLRFHAFIRTEESAALFKELLTIPRLSSSCQVVVL